MKQNIEFFNPDSLEFFDRYLSGEMSQEEKQMFEIRLKTDESFSKDYDLYLYVVKGIIDEGIQDNLEFGHAMKHITKDGLLRAIGRVKEMEDFPLTCSEMKLPSGDEDACYNENDAFDYENALFDSVEANASENLILSSCNSEVNNHLSPKRKQTFNRERWIWVASMAALLLVFITIGISYQARTSDEIHLLSENLKAAESEIDNMIADEYYIGISVSRGGESDSLLVGMPESINNLDSASLSSLYLRLDKAYPEVSDPQDRLATGINMAMVLLRLHHRDEAIALLEKLSKEFRVSDPQYSESVDEILSRIKNEK